MKTTYKIEYAPVWIIRDLKHPFKVEISKPTQEEAEEYFHKFYPSARIQSIKKNENNL